LFSYLPIFASVFVGDAQQYLILSLQFKPRAIRYPRQFQNEYPIPKLPVLY